MPGGISPLQLLTISVTVAVSAWLGPLLFPIVFGPVVPFFVEFKGAAPHQLTSTWFSFNNKNNNQSAVSDEIKSSSPSSAPSTTAATAAAAAAASTDTGNVSSGEGGSPSRRRCPPHEYTIQLISTNPLLIYIPSFVTPHESAEIIRSGTPKLRRSPIEGDGSSPGHITSGVRTSSSAPLDSDDGEEGTVKCVLERAEKFLGGMIKSLEGQGAKSGGPGTGTATSGGGEDDGEGAPPVAEKEKNANRSKIGMSLRQEMGVAQMVVYGDGQKFDLHRDWFSRPKITDEDRDKGRRRLYNRLATFFVVLEAKNIESGSGETWFPHIDPGNVGGEEGSEEEALWRKHEDGGVAVKPVAGNAVFWVNMLMENGTLVGDTRTLHAGLPVKGEGASKKAMNIWPRVFFGPDA